jgi:acyl dehydratase
VSETASQPRLRLPAEVRVGPITRTDIVRFAGAGGDFNPLHHDEAYARTAGFDGVFAMGQMQAGMLSRLVTDWLGLGAVRSYRVRFRAKVWPGDVLVLRATGAVLGTDEASGDEIVECTLEAVREDGGEVAVQGWVTARKGAWR